MLRRPRRLCADLLFIVLALAAVTVAPRHHGARAGEASRHLQLEVYINDVPTKLIGSFVQLDDRRIAARRGELAELGIKPPGSGPVESLVVIDDLGDVAYRYDEPTQRIFFNI